MGTVKDLKAKLGAALKIPACFWALVPFELCDSMPLSEILEGTEELQLNVVETNIQFRGLESPDEEQKLMALHNINELADVHGSKLDPSLISVFFKANEPRSKVRRKFKEVLRNFIEKGIVDMDDMNIIDQVCEYIQHTNCEVRKSTESILRIVATCDNPHVHSKLVELLTDEVWYVRHSALRVLRSFGGWGHTGILTKVNAVLTDPEKKLDTEAKMEIKRFVMQVYFEFSDPAIQQSPKWTTAV